MTWQPPEKIVADYLDLAAAGITTAADERDAALARLAEVEAERDAANRELERWRSGQRMKGLPQVTSVPDGLQFAAALVRAQGTEGGEEHDELLRDAAVRLRDLTDAARHLLAEAVVLRAEREAGDG